MLDKELMFSNIDVSSFDEAVQLMGSKMKQLGYVKDSYVEAVIEREKSFPTGLKMDTYGIAIPHTDKEHVNTSVISVATLSNPIAVCSMINPNEQVTIQLIILMAVKDPSGQVKMLSKLMGLFQDIETLKKLEDTTNELDMFQLVSQLDLA